MKVIVDLDLSQDDNPITVEQLEQAFEKLISMTPHGMSDEQIKRVFLRVLWEDFDE